MRLYLSSFRVGDHPDRLRALLRGRVDIAVIANAIDAQAEDERSAGVEREVEALRALGLRPAELDLRQFADRPAEVAEALAWFSAVWVRGGNVFVLRHALALSGADVALADLVRRDALVYAAYSAGACVLAPSLRGLEVCDDPRSAPAPPIWDGLGVLDRAFVPHVDSPDHPEAETLTAVAARYRADGVPHYALRDGDVLVMDGPESRVRGVAP
ncbi:peptidase [Actinomadura darangshiensis]|uniref:Peptidase n=1 Tax=Actinomadura darangshiensis TaxID=705336 RepID=A0A4V2YSI5_9ACTN|nr:Type 1 glutamine amidotransferase-like domain-containing protein [Actinomadura darangshiensis]TDD70347.1 peptidase [Actinomadura darangshiensis]